MSKRISVFATLAVFLLWVVPAAAQTRHALAIGIDDYDNITDLAKAGNDAQAVAEVFGSLGFSVTTLIDPGRQEINRALVELSARVEPGDEVAFFFAGHGVEIEGQNYLLPADLPAIRQNEEALLTSEAVSADHVLDTLRQSGAGVRIVILDACREFPFSHPGTRSVGTGGGLAQMASAQGEFILFSAGARQVALDHLGDGDANPNSVFTRLLLPRLTEPGLPLHEMARAVREDVQRLALTAGVHQRPTYYDDIDADYSLVPVAGTATSDAIVMPPPPPRPDASGEPRVAQPLGACEAAEDAWNAAMEAQQAAAFEAILRDHADCGRYSELAAMWLDVLSTDDTPVPDRVASDGIATNVEPAGPIGETPFADDIAALVVESAGLGLGWTEDRIAALPAPVARTLTEQLAQASPVTALVALQPPPPGGIETIDYDDGGQFQGQLQDGNWHGSGTYRAPDGAVFEGQFAHGSFSGIGFAQYADGGSNFGEFFEFTPIGLGVSTGADGRQYYGQREDIPHGAGKMTYPDGASYHGDWVYDLRHGIGTMNFANGDHYSGAWVEDVRHGFGTFTHADGHIYSGDWEYGVRHGVGRMTYPDGSEYRGEWRDGLRNGIGAYTATDGSVYVGQWQGDLRHGQGEQTTAGGEIYNGEWQYDVRNGTGQERLADGAIYLGDFLDGMRHGQGEMTYPGGEVYVGDWREGLRHGTGTLTDTSGQSVTGSFVTDVYQE